MPANKLLKPVLFFFLYISFLITIPVCAQVLSFSEQILIDDRTDGVTSVFCADLDGDGDFDVLAASFLDHEIAWYENTDGLGTFGEQQVISTNNTGAKSVFSVDLMAMETRMSYPLPSWMIKLPGMKILMDSAASVHNR